MVLTGLSGTLSILDSVVRDDGTWLTQHRPRARVEDVLVQAVPVNRLLDVGCTELFPASGHHLLAPLCQHPGLARSVVCTQEQGLSCQPRTTATQDILLPPRILAG